jgi:hypothetical protein
MNEEKILNYVKFAAKFSISLYASTELYMILVEHPSRFKMNSIRDGLNQFRWCILRIYLTEMATCSVATVAGLIHFYFKQDKKMLYSTLLLTAAFPFNRSIIVPRIYFILDEQTAFKNLQESRKALQLWGKLQTVKLFSGLIAMANVLYSF